jgi:1-deoxyxylulose-5-phosphate synthase
VFSLPRRVLPGLNTEMSAIGAGCWTIGGPATNRGVPIGWDDVNPIAAYEGLLRAHDLGVTLFDTADVYGLGQSERLLGRLLARVDRGSMVVSSKVGYFAGIGAHPYQPRQIRHQFATTLDNLGTDYLDVYFLHSSDFGEDDHFLDVAVEIMHELRAQSLIRAIGMRAPLTFAAEWATSDRPEATVTARWLHLFEVIRPDVVTVRYNLLSPLYRPQETDIFDFARHHGVGVLIKQALGQGALLRRHTGARPAFSREDHRSRDPRFRPAALAGLEARLARSAPVSATHRPPWRVSAWATPCTATRTRPCWSAFGTPTRSTPPLPAWLIRLRRRRSPSCMPCSTPPPSPSDQEGHPFVQYIEVEKKFALPDPDALKAKLNELGAKPSEPTRQVDAYYNAPHRDFLAPEAISEWLRVRTEDRGSSVNFKRWHPIDALVKTHADEYETKVEDVHAIRLLLEALDFRPLVTVDKTREEWKLPEVEIVFDHVVDAGDFVEFEFKGDAANVEDATEQLEEFIASLGVEPGEPINRGYPHILLGREH